MYWVVTRIFVGVLGCEGFVTANQRCFHHYQPILREVNQAVVPQSWKKIGQNLNCWDAQCADHRHGNRS